MTSGLAGWAADEDDDTASDLSCDFVAFVAERQGIGRKQAEALLASWVANYEGTRRHLGAIGS